MKPISFCALCLLCSVARVHAYEVNEKSHTITIRSLPDYELCDRKLYNSELCLDGLKAYVEKKPGDAFAAAKLVRMRFNHWVSLPLFDKAANKPLSPAQCSDPDLALAVRSGLSLSRDDPNAARARKLSEGTCFEALKPALLAELEESNSYFRDNACPLFDQKSVSAPRCKPEPVAPPPTAAPSAVLTRLKGLDWRKFTLDPNTAQRLLGPQNEEVLLIRPKAPAPDDLVLVKFKGVRGAWNEQVIPTLEAPSGIGKNYTAVSDGREYVAVTVRANSWEAYPKGQRESVRLYMTRLNDRKLEASSADVSREFGAAAPVPTKKK